MKVKTQKLQEGGQVAPGEQAAGGPGPEEQIMQMAQQIIHPG